MHIINISSSGDYMVYILLMQIVANETYVSNRCCSKEINILALLLQQL